MSKKIVLAAVLSFVLSACTSALSNRSCSRRIDNIPFPDLQKQPERYRGAVVILGGQILETIVKEDETRVQVLQLPLGAQQRPDNAASSQGRFMVIYKRFADPLVYEKGRKITVAGKMRAAGSMMLNEQGTTCPCCSSGRLTSGRQRIYQAYAPGPAIQFGIGIGVGR